MRNAARAASLAMATVVGALTPALSQTVSNPPPPVIVTHGGTITPLGGYVIGSVGCAAISPMIGTVILGRELTLNEAYRSVLGCVLGPVGWLLADALVPPTLAVQTQPAKQEQQQRRTGHARNFQIPPPGE